MCDLPASMYPGVGTTGSVDHHSLGDLEDFGQSFFNDLLNGQGVVLALPTGIDRAVVGKDQAMGHGSKDHGGDRQSRSKKGIQIKLQTQGKRSMLSTC